MEITQTYTNKNVVMQINLKSICNLRCKYCALPEVSKSTKSDDEVLLGNTRILMKKLKNEDYNLTLFSIFGAEPLVVAPEIIANIFNLVMQSFPNAILKIQTNGTLATPEYMTKFFSILKNTDTLTLGWSIDGVKELHDKWRDNSFDKADKNLRWVIKNYPDVFNMLIITTQYDHYLVPKYKEELLAYIRDMQSLKVVPTISTADLTVNDVGDNYVGLPKFYEAMGDFLIENDLILNCLKHFNPHYCYRFGNMCQKVLFDLPTGDVYICEKLFDISSKPIANFLEQDIEDVLYSRCQQSCNAHIAPECLECEWFQWCKGGCYVRRPNGVVTACELIKKGLSHIKNNIDEYWLDYLYENEVATVKKELCKI
jgi:radical SAM protein with 4Fe4S-binding SPASM domain